MDTVQILVTGGTGFFGRALIRHWQRDAEMGLPTPTVTILSRAKESFLARHREFASLAWLRFCDGDILTPASLPTNHAFTHVLHAAADSTLGSELSPLARYRQVVDGTRNMLDFSVRCGAKRFLLTSSGAVYGPQPIDLERLPEHCNSIPDPLSPVSVYGIAKRTAEHLCALYADAYHIEPIIARCFAFVGRDLPLDAHFAIGNFIGDAIARRDILMRGDGTAVRSYLDQRDLAAWLIALLFRGIGGRAYNVGSDRALSIEDLALLVRDLVGPDLAIRKLSQPDAKGSMQRYVPDIERARTELGLEIQISLEDAIIFAARHFREIGAEES